VDLADRAGSDVLDRTPILVIRVPLVAVLRDDLLLLRLSCQVPRLVHGPAHRLLHVDVLAGVHGIRRDHRMHVIGRGDDDRVDVLLFLEHLAVVLVFLQPRQLLLDETGEVGAVVLRGPSLVGGELGLRRTVGLEGGRRFGGGGTLGRGGLPALAPLGELAVEEIEIAVADRDDVLAHHGLSIGGAHAVDPDGRDVHEIARCLIPAAEDVTGDDHQARGRGRDSGDEFAAGSHICSLSTPNLQLPTPKGNRSNNGATSDPTCSLVRLRPPSPERFPLGVGSWVLTLFRPSQRTPSSPCAPSPSRLP
jgi:hypothetical protein